MGTHATIAIRHKDNTIDSINCNYDGYLSYTGYILENFYNTPDKAKKLIALGELSGIGYKGLYPEIITHDIERKSMATNDFIFDYIKSYARDLGESIRINHFDNDESFIMHKYDLTYIFDENTDKWYYWHLKTKTTLSSVLKSDKDKNPEEYTRWENISLPEYYDQFAAIDPYTLAQEKAEEYRSEMIGKKYRHFKGNTYKVDTIAVDSETNELRVIYHAIDKASTVCDRPLDMFLSKVDKNKYPNTTQELRFEPVK